MASGYVGDVIKKEYRPRVQSLRDDIVARRDKDFFWPTGTQVYIGRQGSGKTISAVKHVLKLLERYPKAKLVSNVALKPRVAVAFSNRNELRERSEALDPRRQYLRFNSLDQLAAALVEVNNGRHGVIYLIDEIHTYFNALESKNIPMYVFTEISQQRKQRKLILGTSQLFMRMAKPFREQCDSIIACHTTFGIFTTTTAYDGMTIEQDYDGKITGTIKKRGFFFHDRKVRNAFDTFQKVVSGSEQYDTIKKPEPAPKRLPILHKK